MTSNDTSLIEVKNLRKLFSVPRGIISSITGQPQRYVYAIDGVSFKLDRGEILGLVGESGSGKTTIGYCCAGLAQPTEGQILLEGEDVEGMVKSRKRRLLLRRKVQMIFQDPYGSLNPRQTVFDTVAEPLEVHKLVSNKIEKSSLVTKALDDAGIKPPADYFNRYPQNLSGGQRQRVVVASSLVLNPVFLIADEPVSMLDVSIRADILNLLLRLREGYNIAILYITHDLATAGYLCDRVAVLYMGVIVEIGPAIAVLGKPYHPYTQALVSAVPVLNTHQRKKHKTLEGETLSSINLPPGCRFHPRCPEAVNDCRKNTPSLKEIEPGHLVACLKYA